MEKIPSNQNIVSCLDSFYNIQILNLSYLPLGADINAVVYRAQAIDNRCYFIKLKRNYNHEISLAITKLLFQEGIKQVILPVKDIHGQLTQQIDGFVLIVYPFIEGEDGFRRNLTENQWHILGKALKAIHQVEVPLSLQNLMRKETYSDKWRKKLKSLLNTIENENVDNELIQFILKNKETIFRLVDNAEFLKQHVKKDSSDFVLCHSDIHGGNVLLDENNAIYIVDWDDPIMAPKERDLMFIGGGVANVWNQSHEEKAFYKGYGKTQINRVKLAYYRHERIIEDIAIYYEAMCQCSIIDDEKRKILKEFVDMFDRNGVVDIAFKTFALR